MSPSRAKTVIANELALVLDAGAQVSMAERIVQALDEAAAAPVFARGDIVQVRAGHQHAGALVHVTIVHSWGLEGVIYRADAPPLPYLAGLASFVPTGGAAAFIPALTATQAA